MTGVFLTIEAPSLDWAVAKLNALADADLEGEGFAAIGGLIESQTKRRISEEKRAPDGTPWAPWSPSYAASRRKGHSLLQASGALLDSVAWQISGAELRVGSNLVYAAIQQEGGTEEMKPGPAAILARPYLGVSDENAGEINEAIGDWLGSLLQ